MKVSLVVLYLLLHLGLSGQAGLQPGVVAAAGGTYTNAQLQIDWTLGEAIIETVEAGEYILTQGFHQPDIFTVSTPDLENSFSSFIYPNPVKNMLYVLVHNKQERIIEVQLTDVLSRVLWRRKSGAHAFSATIDMHSLSPGNYFLSFLTPSGLHTTKLVKAD